MVSPTQLCWRYHSLPLSLWDAPPTYHGSLWHGSPLGKGTSDTTWGQDHKSRAPTLRIRVHTKKLVNIKSIVLVSVKMRGWMDDVFVCQVNFWNVNCTRATAFIFDSHMDVLEKVFNFLRQKIFPPKGGLNSQPLDPCHMLYHLS